MVIKSNLIVSKKSILLELTRSFLVPVDISSFRVTFFQYLLFYFFFLF